MGDCPMRDASERLEALSAEVRGFLDNMSGRRRKRRPRLITAALGFAVGVVASLAAVVVFWFRGNREL